MGLFSFLFGRLSFSDGEIDLRLANEDMADDECGIEDGYMFYIYPHGSRRYAGYVCLRLGESPALFYLGHIGYRVDAPFRGKHYALKACRLLLPLMRRLGLHSVSITADADNLPSRKTCEGLGCRLEGIWPVPAKFRVLCSGSGAKCRYIWTVD